MAESTEDTRRKRPQDNARYYQTIEAKGMKNNDMTFRIACHNPQAGRDDGPIVSIGLGTNDPDSFARAAAKVTPEIWEQIDISVREALRAAQ